LDTSTPMTVTTTLTKADYRAFQWHVLIKYRKIHWLYGGMLVVFLTLSWFGRDPNDSILLQIAMLVAGAAFFVVGVAAFTFLIYLLGRINKRQFNGTLGQHEISILEDGVIETNATGRIETRLGGIRGVDEGSNHFFVITNSGLGHVLPKRDLQDFGSLKKLAAKVTGKPL
jgi:hypothetical protein